MVSQDIQTDAAVRVDVGVVDTSGEVDLWGLEGVVGREVNVQEENAAGVRRVTLHAISHVPPRNQTRFSNMRELTGPMIVACQWNCKKQACQFHGDIELVDDVVRSGCRREEGFAVYVPRRTDRPSRVTMVPKGGNRTRSSPRGPAEQDEGGSLNKSVYLSGHVKVASTPRN